MQPYGINYKLRKVQNNYCKRDWFGGGHVLAATKGKECVQDNRLNKPGSSLALALRYVARSIYWLFPPPWMGGLNFPLPVPCTLRLCPFLSGSWLFVLFCVGNPTCFSPSFLLLPINFPSLLPLGLHRLTPPPLSTGCGNFSDIIYQFLLGVLSNWICIMFVRT